jgi:hypothetical protein
MMRVASSRLLLEKPLQDVNDEFHRRVIVVQHQYLVHGGLLGARARLHDDARLRPFTTTLPVIRALILIAHACLGCLPGSERPVIVPRRRPA